MNKNTGKAYEKLSSEILPEIYKLKEINGITEFKVEQNTTKPGLSTCHQIDVWLEYVDPDGNERKYAVQAKDEINRISQLEILAFNTIINELECKGIFVTKTGYQRGAIKVAKHYGIQIITMRKPTDEDYFGRMRELCFVISCPALLSIEFVPKTERDYNKLSMKGQWKIKSEGIEHVCVEKIITEIVLSLKDKTTPVDIVLNDGLRVCAVKKDTDEIDHSIEIGFIKFLTETFLCLDNREIEVAGIVVKYRWAENIARPLCIKADDIIQNLYTDILTGEEFTISGLLGICPRVPLPNNLEDERRKLVDSVHGNGAYDAYVKKHPEEKKAVKRAMNKHGID